MKINIYVIIFIKNIKYIKKINFSKSLRIRGVWKRMNTTIKNFLKFPCSFTYKVIGLSQPELTDNILKVIQLHIPGDYVPNIKSSNKGTYISISVTICAKNYTQIKNLYNALSKIHLVRMVL